MLTYLFKFIFYLIYKNDNKNNLYLNFNIKEINPQDN